MEICAPFSRKLLSKRLYFILFQMLVFVDKSCRKSQAIFVPNTKCNESSPDPYQCQGVLWTKPYPECIDGVCQCPEAENQCTYFTTERYGISQFYCGECGTGVPGSLCPCLTPVAECYDDFCQCAEGYVWYEICVVLTSASLVLGTGGLLLVFFGLLIIRVIFNSRKRIRRLGRRCLRLIGCCHYTEEDEQYDVEVYHACNPNRGKTPSYTMTALDFLSVSDDVDLAWAIELSRQELVRYQPYTEHDYDENEAAIGLTYPASQEASTEETEERELIYPGRSGIRIADEASSSGASLDRRNFERASLDSRISYAQNTNTSESVSTETSDQMLCPNSKKKSRSLRVKKERIRSSKSGENSEEVVVNQIIVDHQKSWAAFNSSQYSSVSHSNSSSFSSEFNASPSNSVRRKRGKYSYINRGFQEESVSYIQPLNERTHLNGAPPMGFSSPARESKNNSNEIALSTLPSTSNSLSVNKDEEEYL